MKNIIKSISLLLVVASLTSCLKDDSLVLDPAKGHNVIEWANPGQIVVIGSTYALYTSSYPLGQKATQTMTISYSGPETAAPEDITVNFAVADASVITKYNDEQGEGFELMPADAYSFATNSVVLKKGTNKASFDITFDPDKFDLSKSLVLPLKISSVTSGIISGNFGTILLNVAAKNQYDGVYSSVSGFFQRYTNPTTKNNDGLTGPMAGNPNVTLTTVNATTVEISNLKWGNNAGGVGGINNLQIVIDPVTNLVSMKALGNATLKNVPGKVNKYDPATKTFTLNFDWNQTATKREVIDYIIKFNAPRS